MALRSDALCTVAEFTRLMSQMGIDSFGDNDGDGTADDNVVEDAINWSTVEIMSYLHERYDIADLTDTSLGAELVNRWCVLGSAYFLPLTRGNPVPDSIQTEWDRVVVRLEAIRRDEASLPGISLRDEDIPTLSNRTVDRTYRRSKIRVTRANSSLASSKMSQDFAQDYGVDREY